MIAVVLLLLLLLSLSAMVVARFFPTQRPHRQRVIGRLGGLAILVLASPAYAYCMHELARNGRWLPLAALTAGLVVVSWLEAPRLRKLEQTAGDAARSGYFI